LANVEAHQIARLRAAARCGVIAGIMVKFVEANRVFFVSVDYLEKRFENWQRLKLRGAPRGTASLSIKDLEANAVEVMKLDWLEAIG